MINKIIDKINKIKYEKEFVVIGIDGRCGAGKTTLADKLCQALNCTVVHMDDFFLQPSQRSEERLASPGGNTDRERFFQEVMLPLSKHRNFSYRPYICKTGSMGDEIYVKPSSVTIIEGSYSCHPKLASYYDLSIFADISKEEQKRRIINRNGTMAEIFFNKWIPMEENYFTHLSIKENSDIIYVSE